MPLWALEREYWNRTSQRLQHCPWATALTPNLGLAYCQVLHLAPDESNAVVWRLELRFTWLATTVHHNKIICSI